MDEKLKAAAAQARAECFAARTECFAALKMQPDSAPFAALEMQPDSTPEQRAMYSKCSKEGLLAMLDAYNNISKQRKLTKDDREHLHAIMMACKQYSS